MKFFPNGIGNQTFTVFGAEDQMDQDVTERLRHDAHRSMPFQGEKPLSATYSQGVALGYIIQTRWVCGMAAPINRLGLRGMQQPVGFGEAGDQGDCRVSGRWPLAALTPLLGLRRKPLRFRLCSAVVFASLVKNDAGIYENERRRERFCPDR